MNLKTKQWIHGIVAAASGALASSLSGMAVLPEFFNFSKEGLIHTAKLALVPAVTAVLAYIKRFPTPSDIEIVESKSATVSPDGTVTRSSETKVTTQAQA